MEVVDDKAAPRRPFVLPAVLFLIAAGLFWLSSESGLRFVSVIAIGSGLVAWRVARRRPAHPAAVAGIVVIIAGLYLATIDEPWEDRWWWPGVAIATGTPDPCVARSTDAARRLAPDGVAPDGGNGTADAVSRVCSWGGPLTVRTRRGTVGDLVDEAREDLRRTAGASTNVTRVAGLGDEAFVGSFAAGTSVRVVVRRANVVVEVEYFPDDDSTIAADRAAAIDLARYTVDRVDLR
jgi:hypothetical protein